LILWKVGSTELIYLTVAVYLTRFENREADSLSLIVENMAALITGTGWVFSSSTGQTSHTFGGLLFKPEVLVSEKACNS